MKVTKFIVAASLAAAAQLACAQTLYKLIDKNGKVTYSEEKPKEFDGKVIPMTIDPNANTATLPKANFGKPAPGTEGGAPATKPVAKNAAADKVAAAQESLDKAKAALQYARDNPGPNDMRWLGNVGGGTRHVPTEDYAAKLEALEQGVKQAEDNLKTAERGIW